jgi:hypothetical protein
MKNLIPALLLVLIVACTKETLTEPKSINTNIAANTTVSYKSSSITIVDFKAQQESRGINVTFTTLYEKNIVRLEILKGLTANNLCSIYKQEISTNSDLATNYSTSDQNNENVNTIYYMVKYTLTDGDWGYTPVFKLTL